MAVSIVHGGHEPRALPGLAGGGHALLLALLNPLTGVDVLLVIELQRPGTLVGGRTDGQTCGWED